MKFIKKIFSKVKKKENDLLTCEELVFDKLVIGSSSTGKCIPGAVTGIQIMIAEKVAKNEPIKINVSNEVYKSFLEPLIQELKIENNIKFYNDRVIIDYNMTNEKIEEIFIV